MSADLATDPEGDVPAKLTSAGATIYKYDDMTKLAEWIEAAAKKAGK